MSTILAGLLAVIAVVALFALFVSIGALIVLLAWNVGVVGIAGALGGHVATIGFWTAVGISFLINLIRSILRPNTAQASA